MKAIILGSSGLIGSLLLKLLESDNIFSHIHLYNRKSISPKSSKIIEHLVDFTKLETIEIDEDIDLIFSCLGSTKAKTPNLSDYRKVDFDIPVHFAKLGKKLGIKQFHIVSSMGADKKSMNFYSKLKGEIDEAIIQLKINGTFIYQPSILIGNRNEVRYLEKFSIIIMELLKFLFIGPLKKYKPITGKRVAEAMYHTSLKNLSGIHIYTSDILQTL